MVIVVQPTDINICRRKVRVRRNTDTNLTVTVRHILRPTYHDAMEIKILFTGATSRRRWNTKLYRMYGLIVNLR